MDFFDFLKGDARDTSEPQITFKKTNLGNDIDTNRDQDILLAQLLEKEKLLGASVGAFKNEEERQKKLSPPKNQKENIERNNRLGTLRTPITNYQNQIRDLLRDNGIVLSLINQWSDSASYTWNVPGRETVQPGNSYTIRVSSFNDATVDATSGTFIIYEIKAITSVTAPPSGGSVTLGFPSDIT